MCDNFLSDLYYDLKFIQGFQMSTYFNSLNLLLFVLVDFHCSRISYSSVSMIANMLRSSF